MLWVFVCIALAFGGIAVLGILAVRVSVEVRRLARQVADSSQRLAEATEQLQHVAEPLAAQAGQVVRGR